MVAELCRASRAFWCGCVGLSNWSRLLLLLLLLMLLAVARNGVICDGMSGGELVGDEGTLRTVCAVGNLGAVKSNMSMTMLLVFGVSVCWCLVLWQKSH